MISSVLIVLMFGELLRVPDPYLQHRSLWWAADTQHVPIGVSKAPQMHGCITFCPTFPLVLLLLSSPNQLMEPIFTNHLSQNLRIQFQQPIRHCMLMIFPQHLSSFLLFSILFAITLEETIIISSLDHYCSFLTDQTPVLSFCLQHTLKMIIGAFYLKWVLPRSLFKSIQLIILTEHVPNFLTWDATLHDHTSSDCTTSCLGCPIFHAPAILNFSEFSGLSTVFIPQHPCSCSFLYQ